MLKKYINEEWNWAILIFMLSKSLLEADGFLETTGYIFHDKGTDLITGQKRTIPIYTQVDDIDVTKPEAYKEIQKKCFEKIKMNICFLIQINYYLHLVRKCMESDVFFIISFFWGHILNPLFYDHS